MSLSTATTDDDTFRLFVSKLAEKLDAERPGWREDTIWMLDCAPYHSSHKTRTYLKYLGIRVTFTGPYSYSGSPMELWYAALKSTNLTPTMQATGKR